MTGANLNLPALRTADLDEEGLDTLLTDLAACAEDIELVVKSGPAARAECAAASLQLAIQRFRAGELRGVQIRYRFEGRVWCDTLMRTATGMRLVRSQVLVPDHPVRERGEASG